jgi:archaetidylinositol phosphate synthase
MTHAFSEATRVSTALLAARERQSLLWLAARTPRAVNSDHLTALGLVATLLAGLSYWAGRAHPAALCWAVFWLAANWLGDSLDGTLARVRNCPRPRYGFYIDHVLDSFGVLFIVSGLALSGYMSVYVAGALLIAYYLVSIELYLATYALGTFHMSFCGFGPTELRIVLAVGTVALMVHPEVTIRGSRYMLFDVGGLAAAGGLFLAVLTATARHARELYRAETPSRRPQAR